MKGRIVGRDKEQSEIQRCMDSDSSELVLVYGRRRVGKTFLVNEFFDGKFSFSYTGRRGLSTSRQLQLFAKALQQYAKAEFLPSLHDWFDAFDHLQILLGSLPKDKKKVVFLDEMPWMDSQKSEFVAAFEGFWNGWAALRHDILFIACGSATSWMINKLLHNPGGLFNRVTKQIYLRPFSLFEVEQLLRSRGCSWDRYQIAQCYMVMGGVPFYLNLLDPKRSLAQNIDDLFFVNDHAPLNLEYQEMYQALFRHPEKHLEVMRLLSGKREGLTRQEIMEKTKISGSGLTALLSDLVRCDFIFSYVRYGSQKNNLVYRIKDFYSLFYFRFIEKVETKDANFWSHRQGTAGLLSWQGFSFELLALLHLNEIKKKLGLFAIQTEASVWRSSGKDKRAQIDLVIKRADRVINLCEMKFANEKYTITKDYEQRLLDRKSLFVAESKTRYAAILTMVTTYGVLQNQHSGIINSEVTLDDLFVPL